MTRRAYYLLGVATLLLLGSITIDNGASPPNLKLADNDTLTFGTGNDVVISHNDVSTDLIVDNTHVTGSTVARLGTDTTATAFEVRNDSDSILFSVKGDGSSTFSSAPAPAAHATSHQNGGSDEVATATAAANAIPKAQAGGTLHPDWVDDASATAQGLVELATTAEVDTGTDATRAISPDALNGSAPVLSIANTTGTRAGIDSDATAHAAADGSSHTYINQDVTTSGTPTFASVTSSGGATITSALAANGGITMGDNDALTLGDGSDATITWNAADLVIDATGSTSEVGVQLGTDNSDTRFAIWNDSATVGSGTPEFEVRGDGTVLCGGSACAGGAADAGQLVVEVRNTSGGAITVGQAVYISGFHVGTSLPTVALADADSAATMPAFGLVRDSSIANNSSGDVVVVGALTSVDTSSFSVPDAVYVSGTAGALTSTRPTGSQLIQKVAIVTRSNASAGVLEVFGAGRSNDVPNTTSNSMAFDDDTTLVFGQDSDSSVQWVNASSQLVIDNTGATGATYMDLGTDTSATEWAVRNNSGTALLTVAGDGAVLPSDHLACDDDVELYLGTGNDLTMVHNATNTVFTSATNDFIIDSTSATGEVAIQLGTDTAATEFSIYSNSDTVGSSTPTFSCDGGGTCTYNGTEIGSGGGATLDYSNIQAAAADRITNVSDWTSHSDNHTVATGDLQVGTLIEIWACWNTVGVNGTDDHGHRTWVDGAVAMGYVRLATPTAANEKCIYGSGIVQTLGASGTFRAGSTGHGGEGASAHNYHGFAHAGTVDTTDGLVIVPQTFHVAASASNQSDLRHFAVRVTQP